MLKIQSELIKKGANEGKTNVNAQCDSQSSIDAITELLVGNIYVINELAASQARVQPDKTIEELKVEFIDAVIGGLLDEKIETL